ncbi:hypothetical protein AB205_0045360 [Aquarana catesbeiana]|uniref:Reverse transcriptase zinc-binding domain-containing protein n=1 Tax=Aquarana catesbeiana TaxID=8400 RepID=A0A2G9Q9K5_AQUCT|nr:hypothetical protein AB205_0045360 [Aquarana catesbeiana]
MQFMRGSNLPEERGGGSNILMNSTCHDTIVEAVEADSFGYSCPTVQLMIRSWKTVKAVLGYTGFSEFSPIWNSKNLEELNVMGKIEEWDRRGIHCLAQLYRAGRLKSFQEIREEYAVPNRLFFSYLQVRHALEVQFRGKVIEWSEMPLLRKLIKWEEDVGTITEEQWKYVLALGPRVSLAPSQGVSHLYLIYRSYYTPVKLFSFGKSPDAKCHHCGDRRGDLIHMFWRCPKLHRYWEGIVEKMNSVFGTSLDMEARTCLMSLMEKNGMLKDTQTAIIRCLFQGKKLIARKWQAKDPLTMAEWMKEVKDMIMKEKLWYGKIGSMKKYKSIWKLWLEQERSE